MRTTRVLRFLVLTALLAGAVHPKPATGAPAPLHAYEFQGNLDDSGSGNVPILSEGGVVGAEHYAFDPMYPGDTNQGLTLEHPQLSDFGVYSIEMRLKFDRLRNETPIEGYDGEAWLKIIDYTDNVWNVGLFVEDVVRWPEPGDDSAGLEGRIEYVASGGRDGGYEYVGVGPNGAVEVNEWFHMVLTRDADRMMACYVDGVKMFEFEDVWDDAVIDARDNVLRFLQPDEYAITTWAFPVYEVTQGDVDYLRIYDQKLTEQEVGELYAPPVLVGDYNDDGVVDAADYTVWRDSLGVDVPLANDPVGGAIGRAQYENWKANFGAAVGFASAQDAAARVPEPSTAPVLALVALGFWRSRRPAIR